jgi:hypothetical protein
MKCCVTIVRYGYLFVEAKNIAEALEIANHQHIYTINWSDDWDCTDVYPDDSLPDGFYITEAAF